MKDFNICAHLTDSYKQAHHKLLPDGVETVYNYCEARSGARWNENLWSGLQPIIAKYFTGQVVTREKIEEAAADCAAHFGSEDVFNREGWEYILNECGGCLPIQIDALPEGTVVPTGTPFFTTFNTGGSATAWLVQPLETMLLHVWSTTTVGTGSREVKKIVANFLELTGDPAGLPFKLHDFGFRGVSSLETAASAGAAHLINFLGTDTMAAIPYLRDYYGADEMPGFSIPATEHSIMTSEGPDGEADIVRKVLKAYPTGLVAIVIDSFDTMNFIHNVIGGNEDIMEMIRNREGTVVFRPDSGELPMIDIEVFEALAEVFGTTVNAKGYRVLPDCVRMIQGDGIKWYRPLEVQRDEVDDYATHGEWRHTVEDILQAFAANGISADNIAFGSGGGLLQDFTRDTQCFAIKCSAMKINGEWVDIFKQPKTDPLKNSKRGRLTVMETSEGIQTFNIDKVYGGEELNMLRTVFLNGAQVAVDTLDEMRERAALAQPATV